MNSPLPPEPRNEPWQLLHTIVFDDRWGPFIRITLMITLLGGLLVAALFAFGSVGATVAAGSGGILAATRAVLDQRHKR
jgi:hypothetical protein